MIKAIQNDRVTELETMSRFCDGSAVPSACPLTFDICKHMLDEIVTVPEGKISTTILKLYD